jgi:general secretion pathway protein F
MGYGSLNMRFSLEVVQGRSAPRTLVLSASTIADAQQQARQSGFVVLSARSLEPTWARWGTGHSTSARTSISRSDLVIFLEQLQSLLQAGLSVIESLETLLKGGKTAWQGLLSALVTRLRQGHTLSAAMALEACFPELLVSMIRSAELTSNLPQALGRFLDHERRSSEVRHQIRSVALYPLILIGIGGLVMLFLLFYVMPRFARVFESMNNLPWSAQAMVSWSHALKAHGLDFMLFASGAVALLIAGFSSTSLRARLVARVLNARLFASHLRVYFLARWYRTTGMLVEGGIPLPDAVHLSVQVLPMGLQADGVLVEQGMRDGLSPSEAYGKAGMATAVVEQLLRAGERSGDVGLMLSRAATFHENEVAKTLTNTMRVMEPLVMAVIGIGGGVIVVLMYLPIFELASAIQ